jgi:hypothetical protein
MAQTRRALRRPPRRRQRLDPKREIVLHHVTDGPAKGWLHTHGLAAHGKPELEIRNVPVFLGAAAGALLNDLAGYLLNDAPAPLVAGELLRCGATTIRVLAANPDADQGYDPAHYDGCVRLVLVDPPDSACACDECAKALAGRSPLPN